MSLPETPTTRPDVSKFNVKDLPSIFGLDLRQEWLVEGLIPTKSVIAITGQANCGKSSIVLALADAVVNGTEFLGRPTKKLPVLINDRENGLHIYSERFERFGIKENENLRFWGSWNDIMPGSPDCLPIKKFCMEEQPMIVFDSLQGFGDGWDEQDATGTRQYMDKYRFLAGLGATVILIHHAGKAENSKEYRGSSDIKASIDVGLLVTEKKDKMRLLCIKPFKSREGVLDEYMITLEGTKLVPVAKEFIPQDNKDWQAVESLVKLNPGLCQAEIIKMLPQMPNYRVRKILLAGESSGAFRVDKGAKNASSYFLGQPHKPQ